MTFEECINQIHEGSVINFKEYSLDRHERKRLALEIEGGVVQKVFQANEKLPRETLEEYYGSELEEQDYLQLAKMNCPRIVVSLGLSQDNVMDIKILILTQDFYNTGLQKIEVTNEIDLQNSEEPNYLMTQGGWM